MNSGTVADYPQLFSPLKLGPLRLKNRLMMGSMHTRLEEEPNGFERLAAFYGERAKGGVGLIVTGGFSPNHDGCLGQDGPRFDSADDIPGHREIVDAVHQHGSRILLQILHTGRYRK
ncbi:MAG: NADPH-dependent 2,4-dienoyl-CoA reductase, partial [Gammaproteobacteria bacterium]|nr:NADPH-dependent 2,4-dienoyl-CoA reductase [Gammaproteobacteria bacterium]